MTTFEFLPYEGCEAKTTRLSVASRDLKRRMLDCYTTQKETLRAFSVEVERFRESPNYDFTKPPSASPLYYDSFDWGVTSDQWRTMAGVALRELGLADVPSK